MKKRNEGEEGKLLPDDPAACYDLDEVMNTKEGVVKVDKWQHRKRQDSEKDKERVVRNTLFAPVGGVKRSQSG
jgi:hypothetical protein